MNFMLKIAVIGERKTVMGFTALGLEAYPVFSEAEARQTLRALTRERDDVAIIYVEESFAGALKADIDRYKDSPKPAIILIPGGDGSLGLGLSALDQAVERAIGTNILNDE